MASAFRHTSTTFRPPAAASKGDSNVYTFGAAPLDQMTEMKIESLVETRVATETAAIRAEAERQVAAHVAAIEAQARSQVEAAIKAQAAVVASKVASVASVASVPRLKSGAPKATPESRRANLEARERDAERAETVVLGRVRVPAFVRTLFDSEADFQKWLSEANEKATAEGVAALRRTMPSKNAEGGASCPCQFLTKAGAKCSKTVSFLNPWVLRGCCKSHAAALDAADARKAVDHRQ